MTERDKGTFEKVGAGAGGLAGRVADTGVDLVASMIRTVARTAGGWWSDRKPDDMATSFDERADNSCRVHFDSARRSRSSYDSVRPLYQFGHLAGQNPDYQGRSFEDVESDLRNAWSDDQRTQYGEWDAVRDYVSGGYSARNPS